MLAIQRYIDEKTTNPDVSPQGWMIQKQDLEDSFTIFEEQSLADKKYEERSLKRNDASYF